MTAKEYQHQQYLQRRAAVGADEIRRRNRESYERNKEKTLARGRERYKANREKIIARTSAYNKQRPEICKKARQDYRNRHHSVLIVKEREWRNANRKLVNSRSRKSYRKHRDTNLERNRQWFALHPEYRRTWADRNRESIKVRRRAFRSKNIERFRSKEVVHASKRRALKKLSTVDEKGIAAFIKTMRSKTAVRCFWCSDKIIGRDCHIDHIIALARGGKHSVENLCVSCEACNLKKGAKDLRDWNLVKQNPQLVLI